MAVVSGRGGAGKTSIVASFALLAKRKVLVDCDVEAANLHLILTPTVEHEEDFCAGGKARIRPERCTACGFCMRLCRFGAIFFKEEMGKTPGMAKPVIRRLLCNGCKLCVRICPEEAIDFEPHVESRMLVSKTDYGPMVHARLGMDLKNAGQLVAAVRKKARSVAAEKGLDQVIIDGSSGFGLAVSQSITGTDLVLAVFEPNVSGEQDFLRLAELTAHFRIPLMVCVNKWDLNKEMTEKIEDLTIERNARPLGRVRYDRNVANAMIAGKSVVEFARGGAADDIRKLWEKISES
ncbi:MinD superfamily P-loop ATPase, contains an inserted ferredoxin domain [Syntrophus gentianae]|uniref:MinD superfamily P-loop ATPase, contains an inserted ferredoxin domain n=1 Tax=Syntrophus gentianae TaxID=43775 RepID=A0A1H7V5B2_9BACT|nr:ATP-binding protein [Syntrophus gentianae]SEM04386.1 MinD superfamily P-loop ATPase, contains an inserted ferredoxin domain [Syntrophus gentianae]